VTQPVKIECNLCWDYQKYLKEENEKLKIENEERIKDTAAQTELKWKCIAKYQEAQKEIERLTGISGQLQEENAQLKAKLAAPAESRPAELPVYPRYCMQCGKFSDSLFINSECEHCKTQLQNRDKVSQVERKPHKCPYCHGMREIWHIVVCSICDGTGIVWEPK
jgi:predicted Zn-ribbon and HTH transcriptional regulator